ncbi:hypothetical protein GCM10009555_063380 [Acrocarpospora macrocephala]|nr:universal stress protein [Acrocarpospora macrocephala]
MTIVVGYDGTDYSMQALDWAMDEAEYRQAPLLVAHAWHWPYEPGDDLGRDSLRRAAEHADDHVLEFACREASMRSLRLVVAQAWQYPVGASSLIQPGPLGEEVLGPVTEKWRTKYPEVEITHLLEEGPVPDVLTRLSATATLLVVGAARSPGPLGRIGSVTRPVLHRATCPIAVVRGTR